MSNAVEPNDHFLRQIIRKDIEAGKLPDGPVMRFPPEPNGFLHIGHAKAICVNFGLAAEFGGRCHLRFDDTNPEKESQRYIDAICEDIRWLGFEWHGPVRHASAYFDQLYQWALHLIDTGAAYVCHLSPDEAREFRGTLTEPGRNSPYRERSAAENRQLFEAMRAGEFSDGECVLRAKIDMAAPNMNLRDPILYRIRRITHHQTGDQWCIYPTYDFTHGQSDAIEGVTHSLCSLEFEDHRPLYEWFIEQLPVPAAPRQYEFARLNLGYTLTSKRKLKRLVDENHVNGWDDPRMPTIAGLRRRGVPAKALRRFCELIGVTRSDGLVDVAMLDHAVRDELDKNASRAMCVMDPLEVLITNYPENQGETLQAPGHPVRDDMPARELPFSQRLVIEREDFRESANKKFKRLVLGKKVRLRNAYVIIADGVETDAEGNIVRVLCRYEAETLGADPADGVKPKGVIHWVDCQAGQRAELRVYDRLFNVAQPGRGELEFEQELNPDSLHCVKRAWIEPGLAGASPEQAFQFERIGYFVADRHDFSPAMPVFNQVIGLRDTWDKPAEPAK